MAIVFGGRSAEHEVSVISARSVTEALDPERYEVLLIGIDKQGVWHRLPALPSRSPRGRLPAIGEEAGAWVSLSRRPGDAALVADDGGRDEFDVVFPVLHGPFGEDGTVQGLLELAGVPYVGSGVLASAVGMDKPTQKVIFASAGLPVVPWMLVREIEWERDPEAVRARAADLGLPLFVKPAALGSSVGITKARRAQEIGTAIEEALSFGPRAILERSVEGAREIECAVLGNEEPEASVPGEVVPGGEFYSYAAKYLDQGSRLEIPARIPERVAGRIREMAVRAFRETDAAGMARVDFFYREPDELFVNEINTIPGFTHISMYPKLWEASGLPYARLVERLVELALERHQRERKRHRGL